MSAKPNIDRAPGSKPSRLWVKAKDVAETLSVSLTAVYAGECGMDRIRSAYLPDSGNGGRSGKRRTARRFYWPDVERLNREMLAQTEKTEDIPANILRLIRRRGGRGRRREG